MNREFEKQTENYLRSIKIRYEKTTKRTLIIRDNSLKKFLDFIISKGIESFSGITRDIVSDYSLYLMTSRTSSKKSYAPSTRMRLLVEMKNFLSFLTEEGVLYKNHAAGLELPKLPRRISRDVPKVEEIDLMISMAEPADAAILETLYGTGIRANEIVKLKKTDVDFEQRILTIRHGKYGKQRAVPINNIALEKIKEYLKTRNDRSIFLFVCRGKVISLAYIRRMISRYAEKAGLKKHLIPHSFRYACATHMLKNGADIRYIQDMLGHENLSTTQSYTRVVRGDLKRMIRKYHPREGCPTGPAPRPGPRGKPTTGTSQGLPREATREELSR